MSVWGLAAGQPGSEESKIQKPALFECGKRYASKEQVTRVSSGLGNKERGMDNTSGVMRLETWPRRWTLPAVALSLNSKMETTSGQSKAMSARVWGSPGPSLIDEPGKTYAIKTAMQSVLWLQRRTGD
jgi:hypothetical protein